jgi:sporulation protein YlmC with PRC-barrel domain
MKKSAAIGMALSAVVATSAYAATTLLSIPAGSWTIGNYYKQAVYDRGQNKIGDVDDVLIDRSGRVSGFVINVGGFLGVGDKDVIVPFSALKTAANDDKWWLTLDATKDDLKSAPTFTYNKKITSWAPEKQ